MLAIFRSLIALGVCAAFATHAARSCSVDVVVDEFQFNVTFDAERDSILDSYGIAAAFVNEAFPPGLKCQGCERGCTGACATAPIVAIHNHMEASRKACRDSTDLSQARPRLPAVIQFPNMTVEVNDDASWNTNVARHCRDRGLSPNTCASFRALVLDQLPERKYAYNHQCTLVTMVCSRATNASLFVQHYARIAARSRALAEIRIQLQPCGSNADQAALIRSSIQQAAAKGWKVGLKSRDEIEVSTPSFVDVTVELQTRNSLNNRFAIEPSDIQTACIVAVDDDQFLDERDIVALARVASSSILQHAPRLVGLDLLSRTHVWDPRHGGRWVYASTYLRTVPVSIVVPPYAYPVSWHERYNAPDLDIARRMIDVPHDASDDILINMVAAAESRRGPQVLPSYFSYVDHLAPRTDHDLSGKKNHYPRRTLLLNLLPFFFPSSTSLVSTPTPLLLEEATGAMATGAALILDKAYAEHPGVWRGNGHLDADTCENGISKVSGEEYFEVYWRHLVEEGRPRAIRRYVSRHGLELRSTSQLGADVWALRVSNSSM